MSDQYLTSLIDPIRMLSFDTTALLTNSTINALHFPDLTTSGISDSGGGGTDNRRTSFLLDGIGMCDSMTESFCSAIGQDEIMLMNTPQVDLCNGAKLDRKDSTTQKKRRSRKSQFDASTESPALDKIELVNLIDEQHEADDVWLYQAPAPALKNDPTTENIISWVHKEFKTTDIKASKHRLLCKLDDMSHARTIRSVSCHNFLDCQRAESFKRSSTEQQVRSEPMRNGRLSSPLRAMTPLFYEHGHPHSTSATSPLSLGHSMPITNGSAHYSTNNTPGIGPERSREVSKDHEKQSMDYTDLEVMAKLQLENLRQAERQAPLSKRFGGSSVSLASNSSGGTSVLTTNRSGNKPPVVPKSTVTTRNGVQSTTYHRSNTQTLTKTGQDRSGPTSSQSSVGPASTRSSLVPSNSANNNRTRPPTTRPLHAYRGSQTTFHTNSRLSTAPASSAQRNEKKSAQEFGSTLTSTENGLLHDVSNKPLTAPIRPQVGPQRRTIVPRVESNPSVMESNTTGASTTITRSSSSLSQGRKSGIPTVDKPQRPSTATVTRHHSLTSRRTTMKGF